jgi:hypothetical protein
MPRGYISPGNGFDAQGPAGAVYFYFFNPDAGESPVALRTPVFAPAAGTLDSPTSSGSETGISVRVTSSLGYSMSPVILDQPIVVGTAISAGQRLGTSGSAALVLSVGPVDAGVAPPIASFGEPVRSQLYAKVQRLGPDLDGKFNYDVAGRLSGAWAWEGGILPYRLYFAYDTYDPAQPRLSLGWPTGTGGVFAVSPGDPDPASVSVGSGPVRYTLTKSRTGLPLNAGPGGALLVQMITDTRIRVEWFADGTSASSFTANANTFARTFCAPRSIPPC